MKKNLFQTVLMSIFLTMTAQMSLAIGGADTGGGNILGSAKASNKEINDFIVKSKEPSKYIIRRLEFLLTAVGNDLGNKDSFNTINTIGKKLFKGKKTMYTTLEEAQFNPIEKGPCFDSEGNAVDASAKDFPIICFSLERLSSRLSNDTVQPELLALVLHEVSHGEGVETTESEAVIIQNIVKSGLTNEPYSKILNLVKSYRSDFKDTLDSVKSINEKFDEQSDIEKCTGLTFSFVMISKLLQSNFNNMSDNEKNGISLSSLSEISALQGTVLKIINTSTYCSASYPEYKKITDAYGEKSELSLTEFQNNLYPNAKNMLQPPKSWIIRKITKVSTEALKIELQEILQALEAIYNKI